MGLLLAMLLACHPPSEQTCEDMAKITPGDSSYLYDHNTIQNVQIVMLKSDMGKLATKSDQDVDDVPATIYVNGEKFDKVGLSIKGHQTFRVLDNNSDGVPDGKSSFKLDFHEFDDDQRLNGIKRINLNNMVAHPAKIEENMSYTMFGLADIIAPRQGYTCVSVNGKNMGLYSIIEALDEKFLANRFDDNSGPLYEGPMFADLTYSDLDMFQLKEGDDPDRAHLSQLIEELDNTTPATYWSFLEKNFDAENLVLSFAIYAYLGNRDTYPFNTNNYYLYYEPDRAKWTMIPWGQDGNFNEMVFLNDPLSTHGETGILFSKCLASIECKNNYETQLDLVDEMIAGHSLIGYMASELDRIYSLSHFDPMDEVRSFKVGSEGDRTLDFFENRYLDF